MRQTSVGGALPLSEAPSPNGNGHGDGNGGLGGGHFTADLSGKILRRGPGGSKTGASNGSGNGSGNGGGGGGGPDTPRRPARGGWLRRRWPLLLTAVVVAASLAGLVHLETLRAGTRRLAGGGSAPLTPPPPAAAAHAAAARGAPPAQLLAREKDRDGAREQAVAAVATTAAVPAVVPAAATTGVLTTETTTERTGLPAPSDPRRLLLATHNRLMWYYPLTDKVHILSQGGGMVRYGMFPGQPPSAEHPQGTLWTALRPHNWRPTTAEEWLVELDAATGAQISKVQIPAKFTHDVVRSGDRVYVCDTGHGHVLELEYGSMRVLRRMELFSLKDHPNTLAPLVHGRELWVVLHNLGQSDAVRIDLAAGALATTAGAREDARVRGVGTKAHGLVEWFLPLPLSSDEEEGGASVASGANGAENGGESAGGKNAAAKNAAAENAKSDEASRRRFVTLDSEKGALTLLDPSTGDVEEVWRHPVPNMFLKGLAVVDDVAFFGASVWAEREVRDAVDRSGELIAVDLPTRQLMWRRVVPTGGLLNIVGAPQLGEASTYRAAFTPTPAAPRAVLPSSPSVVAAVSAALAQTGFPARVSGFWASGLPYLDAVAKAGSAPWEAGFMLPLASVDVSAPLAALRAMPERLWGREAQSVENAVMSGRDENMNKFKPGVDGVVLLFSSNDAAGDPTANVFEFPLWAKTWRRALEPLLTELLGAADTANIVRLQLARMRPGVSDIKRHVDSGGYAKNAHRIHVVLQTNKGVAFETCGERPAAGAAASAAVAAAGGGAEPTTSAAAAGAKKPGSHEEICYILPTPAGLVFELNNRCAHNVANRGDQERIHLVVDVDELPHPRVALAPGSQCHYDARLKLLCPLPGAGGGGGNSGGGGIGGGGNGGRGNGAAGGAHGGGGAPRMMASGEVAAGAARRARARARAEAEASSGAA